MVASLEPIIMSNRAPTMYNDRAAAQLAADMMSQGIEAHNPFAPHQHARKEYRGAVQEENSKHMSRPGLTELERTPDIEDATVRKERQDLKLEKDDLKIQGDQLKRELKTFNFTISPNEELRVENERLKDTLSKYKKMLRDFKNNGPMRYEGKQALREEDMGDEEEQ